MGGGGVFEDLISFNYPNCQIAPVGMVKISDSEYKYMYIHLTYILKYVCLKIYFCLLDGA